MKTDHELVTIRDYGRLEYLEGAQMQYSVFSGDHCVAFCATLETARLLANAMTLTGGVVVIKEPSHAPKST